MPKIVGELRIMPLSIAFLYQEILKCGTDGGDIEKRPVIDMCGNFKCGSDHEKLNRLLSLSIALLTLSLAPSNISTMLYFMFVKILVTAYFAALNLLLMSDVILLSLPEIEPFIVSQAEATAVPNP